VRLKSLAALIVAVTLHAQDRVPTFRSETTLVKVDAEVTTPSGTSISNLAPSDFVVTDNGVPQKVIDFSTEGEPLKLVLLLDVSGSMRTHLAELARTTSKALAPLRPGDEVAIMLFSNGTKLVQPFTSDLSSIGRQIIGNVYQSGLGQDTFINDAILDASRYLSNQKGRHAILIVTDNQTLRGRTSDQQVLRAVQVSNAVLDAILVGEGGPALLSARYAPPDSSLPDVRNYARATGGDAVSEGNIGAVFERLVNQIRTRYFLQYSMPPGEPGTHRSIRVTLAPEMQAKYPGAIVHAREGYYIPR
jgi:VWFA-related protein